MNHYDDRASYFAHLREKPLGFYDCLDNNAQQDISLCTYGGEGRTGPTYSMQSDFQQDV